MPTVETQGFLRVDEVARALRCSRDSVYRRIHDGQLEARRIGETGPLRVRAEAVERLLRPVNRTEGNA